MQEGYKPCEKGTRTLRSTIDLLGVKLFVEIIFPLQESGNSLDQYLCLVFEFHEILSAERIRWIIISFFTVFHQLGEYVGVFRFEGSRLNEMLTKKSECAFMAFGFKPLRQKQTPDAVKEGIIEF